MIRSVVGSTTFGSPRLITQRISLSLATKGYWLERSHWPGYSNEEVPAIGKQPSLPVPYVENIEEESARLLAQNKILAWFQGRMESGPRALGIVQS